MFKDIETVPNLPMHEKETIEKWSHLDVVNKIKELRKDSPEKVYFDGPITANGMPHYGHAITWTMKDIVPRYWAMKNYLVERSMGWDTKGILVEYEVEKVLGFEKKEDIVAYGVDKFIQQCRDFVKKYEEAIFHYETRIGRWFDPAIIYSTAHKPYVESIWWSLKELYSKGLLYKGHKVVAYSTRAGTTLSSHEVADGGYKEITDPFITVKFKLLNEENTYVLAWTTTPWTIPANLLLAVGKKIDYVKVESEGSKYILAKSRVENVFEGKEYSIIEEIPSSSLEGLEYEPVFKYYENKKAEGCFKIVFADHANDEDGTGIVHLAPYGEEDYGVFMDLKISIFDYLDDTANFTKQIPEYAGMFYKKADKYIIEDLKKMERLFNNGTIEHRMPMCYRTGTPLMYKPVKSWYVAVNKIKERMIEENNNTDWSPEHVKKGSSGMWIENARDWALSRNRYWGTPMPIWENDETGEVVIIGSFEELETLSGTKVEDPHRPFIDEITWEDKVNGGVFRRIPDVLDVWYDSGAMPFAHMHYPFENTERFKKNVPAEFISEGPDQIRLWFYVMHVLGVALFDQIPYKHCVTIGMLLDETGKKMSKSKRNYKPMDEVLDEYGGDVLRYFILNSTIVSGQDAIFSADHLKDARKDFFIPLWNSVKYFITYANMYNFEPVNERPTSDDVLDKWIISRLDETINRVTEGMEKYRFLEATRHLSPFVSDLSTWYIRRSRDRIKNGDMAAISTLYYVLSQFTKLIAPFLPFISEKLYEVLNMSKLSNLESVHFDFYPETRELTPEDSKLLVDMQNTRDIVSLSLAIRVEKGIKVRQPLGTLTVFSSREEEQSFFEDLIQDEVNVKKVVLEKDQTIEKLRVELDLEITEDLRLEGLAREMVRKLQDLRKQSGFEVIDEIEATYEDTEENRQVVTFHGEDIKSKVMAVSLEPSTDFTVQKTQR